MDELTAKTAEKIRHIAFRHSDALDKVSYFGSRARGDHNSGSDLDLFVKAQENELALFLDELNDMETLLIIDVTIFSPVMDGYFFQRICEEEIILFQSKFLLRYENFQKAVARLSSLSQYTPNNSFDEDVLCDSYITRFQFCYELSWKTLKEYFIKNGLDTELFPKSIFKLAYKQQLITEESLWLQMIKDRNLTSHEYTQVYSRELVARIKENYIVVFQDLLQRLAD